MLSEILWCNLRVEINRSQVKQRKYHTIQIVKLNFNCFAPKLGCTHKYINFYEFSCMKLTKMLSFAVFSQFSLVVWSTAPTSLRGACLKILSSLEIRRPASIEKLLILTDGFNGLAVFVYFDHYFIGNTPAVSFLLEKPRVTDWLQSLQSGF